MSRFHVRIAKNELIFSAAHFITFEGGVCERLHGHNYRVAAEVYGPLGEGHYVVDFLALRDLLREIVGELDHRVLLPAEHESIRIAVKRSESGRSEVEARHGDCRWVFPEEDCLLLPVANTTAEQLAEYMARRLIEALTSRGLGRPERVLVEVEESDGMSAVCELSTD